MQEQNFLTELEELIKRGPSPFHVAERAATRLEKEGFIPLDPREEWRLSPGGKYYCRPFDGQLFAFTTGDDGALLQPPRFAAAHTDFPALKIKPSPDMAVGGYTVLNTEIYGGPLLRAFFDRPLSAAGKVALASSDIFHPDIRLVDFEKPVFTIPSLAIHMDPKANEGTPVDAQTHLRPLAALSGDGDPAAFLSALAGKLGCLPSDILDFELYVYDRESPEIVGLDGAFLSSPRLDNLTSVSALLTGIINGRRKSGVNIIALFDNEEIGSRTKQGADSALLRIVTEKIYASLSPSADPVGHMLSGMLLSVDVAHAFHPNYPAVYDPVNRPVCGKGVVIKTDSRQGYAWDCEGVAIIRGLCEKYGIPFQRFAKHSGKKGGSTIGSMLSSLMPMVTVDIGVPILAMHAARETMGVKDQASLEKLMIAYFSENGPDQAV